MPIDEATKRRIMDLYFNEHKSIREIAKITKKSSRDITPVLRTSEYKGKDQGNERSMEAM
jgi:transposase